VAASSTDQMRASTQKHAAFTKRDAVARTFPAAAVVQVARNRVSAYAAGQLEVRVYVWPTACNLPATPRAVKSRKGAQSNLVVFLYRDGAVHELDALSVARDRNRLVNGRLCMCRSG